MSRHLFYQHAMPDTVKLKQLAFHVPLFPFFASITHSRVPKMSDRIREGKVRVGTGVWEWTLVILWWRTSLWLCSSPYNVSVITLPSPTLTAPQRSALPNHTWPSMSSLTHLDAEATPLTWFSQTAAQLMRAHSSCLSPVSAVQLCACDRTRKRALRWKTTCAAMRNGETKLKLMKQKYYTLITVK